jgi:hypothetical protein
MFARVTPLVLAAVLAVTPAAMARTQDEVQAPRGQDVQAPQRGHGPDVPTLRRCP